MAYGKGTSLKKNYANILRSITMFLGLEKISKERIGKTAKRKS